MYDAFITGASGFIGSHLTEFLISKHKSIVATYHNKEKLLESIRSLKKVSWDITEDFESIPSCKVWYHLASLTDMKKCNDNPELAREVNTQSIINVLNNAEKSNCETFVYISTLGVYGEPRFLPMNETHPTNPVEVYSRSKKEAEELLLSKLTSIKKTVIVRLFNTFGPKQNEFMIIPYILNNLKRSRSIEIKNFYSSRDFTYISDIVNGIFLAGLNGRDKEIYNLGSGNETSIENLIQTIRYILNIDFKVAIKDVNYAGYDTVKRSQADITKAKKELLWKPIKTLEDGLLLTSKILGLPEELT